MTPAVHTIEAWRFSASDLEIELGEESGGVCADCGNETRKVWGYAHLHGGGTVASYSVTWTVGASLIDHPANWDLIIGSWGDGTSAEDRTLVSLLESVVENALSVMVIDANTRLEGRRSLAASALARAEVIGTPLADITFAIVDAIWLQDARLLTKGDPADLGDG